MRMLDLIDGVAAAAGLFLRPWRWRVPDPDSVSLAERLAALPASGAPVGAPVSIRWDEHQIPFIEAASDEDLAVALGVVHAHLRRAQMELMRRIARGRLAETVGPFGVPIDTAIRTIGIARAVPDIVAMLPEDTRRWVDGFVAGVNHAIAHTPVLPMEMRALDLPREDWTVEDVVSVGRIAASDITWMGFMGTLGAEDQEFARRMWRRNVGLVPDPDSISGEPAGLAAALRDTGDVGSNCFALMGHRTANGAAWIASDPHLGATLPNLWLIAGYKSPSYHLAGFMIPGVPMAALGRNPWIAWGGTNLHAMSSDLFDVTDLPDGDIKVRTETLRVRGRADRTVTIRDTGYGPIVSDLSFFPGRGKRLALRWVGHGASDELTSMLRVNRARDWSEFRIALDGFAAPGQNMLYADAKGHIGKLMAAHLPLRPTAPPESAVLPRAAHRHWRTLATASDLPQIFDPPEGYLASANDKPGPTPIPVGFFFSTATRIERFGELLGPAARFTLEDFSRIQRDVAAPRLLPFRDVLLRLLDAADQTADTRLLRDALASWDGVYDEQSRGALAFELLIFQLGQVLLGKRFALYARSWDTRGLLAADFAALDAAKGKQVVAVAAPLATRAMARFGNWGAIHRLRLPHALARLPLLGRRLAFGDWPVGGNSETILKSGGGFTDKRHFAGLVAVSRHVSDMGDLDANFFVLLGGQDGWLGSTTLLDQVALWRDGTYVQVPLRPETVRARFIHETILRPTPGR